MNAARAKTLLTLASAFFLLVLSGISVAKADVKDAVVIIYAEFPGGDHSIGTGAFVDHDGLILTADHVIHRLSMKSPATSMRGSVPTRIQPTKIVVYSSALKSQFAVNPTQIDIMTTGQLSADEWMDIALLRVPLTDVQKHQIQPLDVSPSAPAQTESLIAYGPLCTNPGDERCFQPAASAAILSNDPAMSRDYQVRINITTGYSGGPLVNSSYNIVGIASWGDIVEQGQVTRASYIPSRYIIREFLERAPKSPLFASADVCSQIHAFTHLTAFDWGELSQRWVLNAALLQSQDQCDCCCDSLDKTPNAISTRVVTGNCNPPFCAEQRFYSVINGLKIAQDTNAPVEYKTKAYEAVKIAFHQIDVKALSTQHQETILTTLGQTVGALALSTDTTNLPAFSDARLIALSALMKTQLIHETSQNYQLMGALFKKNGDNVDATAANVLGMVLDLPASSRAQLKINTETLRHQVGWVVTTPIPMN